MGSTDRLRAICHRIDPTTGGLRGQYSIERLCELSEYSQQTPLWRAALVLFLSIIPSLLTIVGLNAMPLQDPYAGWDRNSVIDLPGDETDRRAQFTPGYRVPADGAVDRQVLGVPDPVHDGRGQSAVDTHALREPRVPDQPRQVCSEPGGQARASAVLESGESHVAVPGDLPVYNAIFRTLQGVNQFAFIFVLPVLKALLKKLARKVVADVDELVPVVATTVDLFNALFQAKFMQSSGSTWTTVGITVIDAIQNVYTLRRFFRYMAEVQQTMDSCKSPEQLDLRALRAQSLHQTHVLLRETAANLHRLRGLQQPAGQQGSTIRGVPNVRRSSGDLVHSLQGVGLNAVVPWCGVPRDQLASRNNQQTVVLQKTLELLWKCESVLLVEYIEAVVPLMYGVSVNILYHLPNAKYYPDMAEMTSEKVRSTVSSILIYSALEFGSLLYLHVALKWRFQISALHQLGFVLERQWLSIQGMFLAWVIIALGFTLVHNGKTVNARPSIMACGFLSVSGSETHVATH